MVRSQAYIVTHANGDYALSVGLYQEWVTGLTAHFCAMYRLHNKSQHPPEGPGASMQSQDSDYPCRPGVLPDISRYSTPALLSSVYLLRSRLGVFPESLELLHSV